MITHNLNKLLFFQEAWGSSISEYSRSARSIDGRSTPRIVNRYDLHIPPPDHYIMQNRNRNKRSRARTRRRPMSARPMLQTPPPNSSSKTPTRPTSARPVSATANRCRAKFLSPSAPQAPETAADNDSHAPTSYSSLPTHLEPGSQPTPTISLVTTTTPNQPITPRTPISRPVSARVGWTHSMRPQSAPPSAYVSSRGVESPATSMHMDSPKPEAWSTLARSGFVSTAYGGFVPAGTVRLSSKSMEMQMQLEQFPPTLVQVARSIYRARCQVFNRKSTMLPYVCDCFRGASFHLSIYTQWILSLTEIYLKIIGHPSQP